MGNIFLDDPQHKAVAAAPVKKNEFLEDEPPSHGGPLPSSSSPPVRSKGNVFLDGQEQATESKNKPQTLPDATEKTVKIKNIFLNGQEPKVANKVTEAMGNVLKGTGGAVMKGLEILDRPRSMTVAGVQAIKGDRPASDIAAAAKGEIHPSWSEVLPDMNVPLPSISKGHKSPMDVNNEGKTANAKNLVGFAADMVLDPLNAVSIGLLTKAGKAGRVLKNIVTVYGDDIYKATKLRDAEDIAKALREGSPKVMEVLQKHGVANGLIKTASTATDVLKDTLPEQAKAGQWAAAQLKVPVVGAVSTPAVINEKVATALDKTRKALPKIPAVREFVNYTGDDAFDQGAEAVRQQHAGEINNIVQTGKDIRKSTDSLTSKYGDKAFNGKSPAAWYESEGGVWMNNLLGGNVPAHEIAPEKKTAIEKIINTSEAKDLTSEGKRVMTDLMKKEYPEVNGVKPYFAPGGSDKTFDEYVAHNISGSAAGSKPQGARVAGLHMADESLTKPDFIFQDKNGNHYYGTVYKNVDGQDRLHAIITETEKDGRVREITNLVIGDKNGGQNNRIAKTINDKFNGSKLEYLGDDFKTAGQPGTPAPATDQELIRPSTGSAPAGKNILEAQDEAVKVGMAQEVAQQQRKQFDDLQKHGFTVGDLNGDQYAYAPHVAEEKTTVDRLQNLFKTDSAGTGLPKKRTPHQIPREIQWIQDPTTGQEVLDSVSRFATEKGVPAETLKTRPATVDDVNKTFGKDFFRKDLAEAVTIGALNNEKALNGARQLDFFYNYAKDELKRVGKNVPSSWRTPQLAVPKRFISIDGETMPIRDKLSRLQATPMPAEKARYIERQWRQVAQPEQTMKELKSLYSAYTGAWKRYTLFPFAEYHFRNMVGDLWNGWMNGWRPSQMMQDIPEAMKIQGRMFGEGTKTPNAVMRTGLYGKIRYSEVLKRAQGLGVIGSGQYGEIGNIMAAVETPKGKTLLQKIKKQVWDLEKPIEFGSYFEDNRRLALFNRRLKEGDTFEQAAKSVAGTLYDYGDLTPTEEAIRRWAVPFYAWYRKNIPAQMKYLITKPGKVSALPKMKAAVEGTFGSGVPEQLRPDWMREEYSIDTGKDKNGNNTFAMLGSYLPTADLFSMGATPDEMARSAESSLNPLIKSPMEILMNKDYFRNKPIDSLRDKDKAFYERGGMVYGNERGNYLGADMPTTMIKAMEMLPFSRMIQTADRTNPFGVFDQGDGYEPKGVKEGQIKTRPYHSEMTTGAKVAKLLTGLKIYPADIDRQAKYSLQDLKSSISRDPGLNESNIKAAIKRATMEGDSESVNFYMELLDEVRTKQTSLIKTLTDFRQSQGEEQ